MTNTPIAAIPFASAYSDVAMIKTALSKKGQEGVVNVIINADHLKFFDQKNISLDQKIALINAIGWGKSGNMQIFRKHLETKYSLKHDVLDSVLTDPLYPGEEFCFGAMKISAADLCLLGYLQVLNYSDQPILAYKAAYRAALLQPKSECAAVVIGLIMAQTQAEYLWCDCVDHMMSLRNDINLTQDKFRPEASKAIYAYFEAGVSKCHGSPVSTGPDAVLITKQQDSPIFNSVIFYDEEIDGTRIHILIMNQGSDKMPECDIELLFNDEEEGMGKMIHRDRLPAIQPGETIEKDIYIPNYKAYNPNVDLKISIDPDNLVPETNEENNSSSFNDQG